MFSKSKNDSKIAPQPQAAKGDDKIMSSKVMSQKGTSTATPSIIAAGVKIAGNMITDGEVQLDGEVVGNLTCKNITMGETGSITGNIVAEEAIVRGYVNGEVHARTVRLEKSARLEGDVYHLSLAVEAGAVITGQFRHSETVTSPAEKAESAQVAAANKGDKPVDYKKGAGSAYADDEGAATPGFLGKTSAAE